MQSDVVEDNENVENGVPNCRKLKFIDRQGLLQRVTVATTAGILGSSITGAFPSCPNAANAIGELPEWASNPRFTQHLVINVPDMAAALSFYMDGLQMHVLRSRLVGGQNSTFVGYGPETLKTPKAWYPGVSSFSMYGAHFVLELNEVLKTEEGDTPVLDPGNAVAYLQLAVPSLRLSKLAEAGGKIKSAYGWVLVDSPGGLRHQVIVGMRRDPIMMLALNVPDVQKASGFYVNALGMREQPYPLSRIPESIYEPKQPKGSRFLAFSEDGFGILLLPLPKKEAKAGVRLGGVVDKLAILGTDVVGKGGAEDWKASGVDVRFAGEAPGIGTKVAVTNDPVTGLGVVLVEANDLEKELVGTVSAGE
ncbi:hypothetical protein NGA_0175600 [Nannochloropsis gaditana CCMP526]|uniref:uncharacterized protein n=1 Tax=Nannochloropsis gaditana (strain CCMP526) TaxID=1093141 RepID=UPI00029F6FE4|nr:hypothetical protein NGA_0175600 [Nannochloropsis gaditana CCMP526]EKU21768.1 hypothetical protein NGA_0175600 [Nannochloropsis gaditana CCMP526]|eukprot:XP_005854587.1 hypothetical protein NGA_0175600 [Nannochloropsis gaditana CCMP526]